MSAELRDRLIMNANPSSFAPDTIGVSGQGNLLSKPLDPSMGQAVIQWLRDRTEVGLPPCGLLAGQSVLTALMALYGKNPNHQGPLNDVDVFWCRTDGLMDEGWLDKGDKESFWMRMPNEAYDQIFERRICIISGVKIGRLNLIEQYAPTSSKHKLSGPQAVSTAQRLDLTLADFDLSCVEVGVDLSTGLMKWTKEFESCMAGKPVIATEISVPERTWMRALKKHHEMPWLTFDIEQIASSVQLHQVYAYMQVSPDHKMSDRLEGWQKHHESALLQFDTQGRITPMWNTQMWRDWDQKNIDLRARADNVRRIPTTLIDADALVINKMLDHYKPVEFTLLPQDELSPLQRMIKLTSSDNHNHGDLPLPNRGKMLLEYGSVQDFDAYLSVNAQRLFDSNIAPRLKEGRDLIAATCLNTDPGFMAVLIKHVNGRAVLDVDAFFDSLTCAAARNPVAATQYADLLLGMTQEFKDDDAQPLFHRALMLLDRNEHLMRWWAERGLPGDRMCPLGRSAADIILARKSRTLFNPGDRYVQNHSEAPQVSAWMQEHLLPDSMERIRLKQRFAKALDNNDVEQARRLIREGVNPNHCVVTDVFAMASACFNPDSSMLKMLLEEGIDVDAIELDGRTGAMIAAREDNHQHLQMLIDAGARLDLQSSDGSSALDMACKCGRLTCVRMLLDAGAPWHTIDECENDPMDNALLFGKSEVVAEFLRRSQPGHERDRMMSRIETLCECSQNIDPYIRDELAALMTAMKAQDQMKSIIASAAKLRAIA